MKTCPKCGKELADELNVCTGCGTKVSEPEKPSVQNKETPIWYGILMAALAVIGIVLILAVSAIFGMIVYGLAFAGAFVELRKDELFGKGDYVGLVKNCFTKENWKLKGVLAGVVVIAPLVVILGIYGWIVLDTIRTTEAIYSEIDDLYY